MQFFNPVSIQDPQISGRQWGCKGNPKVVRIEAAFRSKPDRYPNLTIKKIPKAVLSRCEWGKDDYSLQVENLPKAPPPRGQMELISAEEINHIEHIDLKGLSSD